MADASIFSLVDWAPIVLFSILVLFVAVFEYIQDRDYFAVKLLFYVSVLYIISILIFTFFASTTTEEQVTYYLGSTTLSEMKTGFIIGYVVSVIGLVVSSAFREQRDSPPPRNELIPIRAAGTMIEIGVTFAFLIVFILSPQTIAQFTPAAELEPGDIRSIMIPSLAALMAFQFVIVIERVLQAIQYGSSSRQITNT